MTIAIIIGAHGTVSKQLLYTAEMIVGKQENITWIDLLPEENTDTLIKKYNTQLSKLNVDSGVLFLIDTWGGTPFNAAHRIIINHKNYDIVTGVNIPMLIEVLIARENIYILKKLVHIAIESGSESIKSVQFSSSNFLKETLKNKSTDCDHTLLNTSNNPTNTTNMDICLIRIDDRLIHGQVVTRWAKDYNINRIIVVNDIISNDTIRKKLLTQVTPPGITAHVVSIDKAIRVYNNPKYSKDKVIMLFTNPTDILRLIKEGVPIKSINIGGMSFKKGKKQINNAVSIDLTDIKAFKQLDQLGVKLEIRKVPSDSPLNLIKLIENINLESISK